MKDGKIVSIIPADGWNAVYGKKETEPEAFPLVCFALYETVDGNTAVRGMDAGDAEKVSFCDEDPEFIGYVHSED